MRPLSWADLPKRLFDIVMATSLLTALAPLMGLVALVVRLRLGSPVIFRQQRPGLRGRLFTMYKFRTMVAETTDATGQPLTDAQRTPPLARRMRAMSIDELPELWNVLKGDMSLVGPRPLLVEYLPLYTAEQARRHDVRPGITGLAQVHGRNAIDWDQKFALDIKYVEHHDLRMDAHILAGTIRAVLTREGVSHSADVDMPWFTGPPAAGDREGDDR